MSNATTISEREALTATLTTVPADTPTACAGWRAHEIVAHLVAGAKEHADLIEHRLAGHGERPTRGFEEREAPMRALEHDTLLQLLATETRRKNQAYAALAASTDPTHAFTGTRFSKQLAETHARSEAALHRWDITGDDDTSARLLAQPELTTHAVWVLNNMPVLAESAQAIGRRAAVGERVDITFRVDGQPDVVLMLAPDESRFELLPQASDPDLVLTMEGNHRPLVLWGRRPAALALRIEGDRALLPMLEGLMWPNATPWP
jgi:hypothetical protein